jgi:hypothetical protein
MPKKLDKKGKLAGLKFEVNYNVFNTVTLI